MKQPANLDDRIAAAFAANAKSDIFEDLIADVETAAKAAAAASAAARTRALDPVLRTAEAASARRESDDATFRSDRLQAATVRLRDRQRQVSAAEENARRTIAYDQAVRARDALAKELRETLSHAGRTARRAVRARRVNNNEIAAINNKLPEGGSRVLEAELVARELRGFPLGTSAISIIEGTRLPNFVSDVHAPYLWPQSDRMRQDAVVLAIRA